MPMSRPPRSSAKTIQLIMVRHIMPNIMGDTVIMTSLWVATAIRTESVLGFLGLGAQPPQPSWGVMIKDGLGTLIFAPWLAIAPRNSRSSSPCSALTFLETRFVTTSIRSLPDDASATGARRCGSGPTACPGSLRSQRSIRYLSWDRWGPLTASAFSFSETRSLVWSERVAAENPSCRGRFWDCCRRRLPSSRRRR